jgi:hypothetical protein
MLNIRNTLIIALSAAVLAGCPAGPRGAPRRPPPAPGAPPPPPPLAHHELTDAIPAALDAAIPRGSRTPASTGAIAWHQFDRATFDIGREEIPIPGTDQTIGIYSPERSITDAFRLRGEVGYELSREALKEWLRRGGKPARLMEIASRLPRAKSPVLRALEALA